jgi:hypothetical protein
MHKGWVLGRHVSDYEKLDFVGSEAVVPFSE